MKKILALVMVLGIASLATAGLSLSAVGSVATVASDSVDPYVAFIAYSDTLDAAAVVQNAIVGLFGIDIDGHPSPGGLIQITADP